MDFIIDNIVPIAVVLVAIIALYTAEIFVKRSNAKKAPEGKGKRSGIIVTVLSIAAIALNLGLCAYLFLRGGEISDVLPILLISLLGAMI